MLLLCALHAVLGKWFDYADQEDESDERETRTLEDAPPDCQWWNGTGTYEPSLCSHFALSRMVSSITTRAEERALQCATYYDTECVLSFEIGVEVPSCFVYDATTSQMRMLIAPRVLVAEGEASVRVQDPSEPSRSRLESFARTVEVEYMPANSKRPASEVLHNASAWCVQMLRAGIAPACWQGLD